MERKVIKPSFNHYGLITGRLAEMKAWYETVIGMTTIHDQSLHGALAKSQSRVIERSDLPTRSARTLIATNEEAEATELRTDSIPSRQKARKAARPGHPPAAPVACPRADRQGPSLAPLACVPRWTQADGQRHQAPRGRFPQALRPGRLTEELVCRTQRSDEGRIYGFGGVRGFVFAGVDGVSPASVGRVQEPASACIALASWVAAGTPGATRISAAASSFFKP